MARAVHDVGGLAAGPIDRSGHELSPFEKRIDAMLMLLTHPDEAAFAVDSLRRAVEAYNEQDYDSLTYYERWLGAIKVLLIEQQVLGEEEIDAKVAEIEQRLAARRAPASGEGS